MEGKTYQKVLLVFYIVTVAGFPNKSEILKNDDTTALIMGEGVASTQLNIKPGNQFDEIYEDEPINKKKVVHSAFNKKAYVEDSKTDNDPVDFDNEDIEDITELVGEQFSQPNEHPEPTTSYQKTGNKQRGAVRVPGASVNVASANPIYITIPIYISKTDSQPLKLNVGGHDIPVTPKTQVATNIPGLHHMSPTSQYNRLLKQSNHVKSSAHKSLKKNNRQNINRSTDYQVRKTQHQNRRQKPQSIEETNNPVMYRFYF